MPAILGEHAHILPSKIIDTVRREKLADVVVVGLDMKGEVKVFGSSGGEVSDWMMKQASKVIRNVKRRRGA